MADKYLQVDVSQFRRVGDAAPLNGENILARAHVFGGRVRVTLCVDRRSTSFTNTTLGDAGTYSGTVSITDPWVTRVDLPLTIALAYPAWPVVLLLVLPAIVAAAWATYIAKRKTDEVTFKWSCWTDWTKTSIGIISIFAGTAGAIAVYNSAYLANETWGSNAHDVIALVGASFTAFLAATMSLHVASLVQKRHDG